MPRNQALSIANRSTIARNAALCLCGWSTDCRSPKRRVRTLVAMLNRIDSVNRKHDFDKVGIRARKNYKNPSSPIQMLFSNSQIKQFPAKELPNLHLIISHSTWLIVSIREVLTSINHVAIRRHLLSKATVPSWSKPVRPDTRRLSLRAITICTSSIRRASLCPWRPKCTDSILSCPGIWPKFQHTARPPAVTISTARSKCLVL